MSQENKTHPKPIFSFPIYLILLAAFLSISFLVISYMFGGHVTVDANKLVEESSKIFVSCLWSLILLHMNNIQGRFHSKAIIKLINNRFNAQLNLLKDIEQISFPTHDAEKNLVDSLRNFTVNLNNTIVTKIDLNTLVHCDKELESFREFHDSINQFYNNQNLGNYKLLLIKLKELERHVTKNG